MIEVLRQTVMVTGFVFVMMLVIEYVNVLTSGAWRHGLARNRWGQYLLAASLGVVPGCLGAFAVVAMYSHRLLSLGAVVAAMIATSGDEQFVMLALVPRQAVLVFAVCFVLGIAVGALVDSLGGKRFAAGALCCDGLEIHEHELARWPLFDLGGIRAQWRECSAARGILATVLLLFLAAVMTGQIEPPEWNWVRVTLVAASAVALFIVASVPDHFLEEHLWRHVARRHLPSIFLWTLGALTAIHLLVERAGLDVSGATQGARWIILAVACLVGLIPQSGPHLVFVTLYARGEIPFSVLLASSIVQDGHGMLPMLAQSRRAFVLVKGIAFVAGIAVGAAALAMGW
jgi:hypothetical protein